MVSSSPFGTITMMFHEEPTSEPGDKVAEFWMDKPAARSKDFYNTYDYSSFWKGRDYEHKADQMAVRRLIKRIPPPHRRIIDVGGGMGRMASLYVKKWDRAVLLDSSSTQLAHAKKNVSHPEKIEFIEGSAEAIPLPTASCDAALCVRTFHHMEDYRPAIKEIGRVLVPGGYLILEIPNKIHMKARATAYFSKNSVPPRGSISRSIVNEEVPFFNHHPVAIRDTLLTEWFEIVETLSVSNFRSPFLKKIVPLPILLFFERIAERPLARVWFGPSIYFLAKKRPS